MSSGIEYNQDEVTNLTCQINQLNLRDQQVRDELMELRHTVGHMSQYIQRQKEYLTEVNGITECYQCGIWVPNPHIVNSLCHDCYYLNPMS